MTEGKTRNRLRVLSTVFVLIFAALSTRLWFLQILATDQFAALAQTNQVRVVAIEPVRGQILDRNGNVLVDNRPSLIVTIDKTELGDHPDEVLARLAVVLGVSEKDLRDRVDSVRYGPYQEVPIAEDVPKDVVFYLEEHADLFPGVHYVQGAVREYPDGTLAAHILGYVGQISQDQLDSQDFHGYEPGEEVGKTGVEAYYDRFLYGVRGKRGIQVNAKGEVLNSEFQILDPKGGDNLVLTLDRDVQRLAEQALADGIQLAQSTPVNEEDPTATFNAPGGAVVVMDPHNGQVVAMASYPTFDPSIFVDGVSTDEAALLNDPTTTPQLNRAIQGQYPPGSTFKPFIAAGALHEKFASLTGSYDCPAEWEVPADFQHTKFHNWDPIDQGPMSLSQALVQSCDTVFYQFGYDYWQKYANTPAQSQPMQDDLLGMGFGAKTGIDLPGEAPGRIPTAKFKYDLVTNNPQLFGPEPYPYWVPGDNVNMSIGQGFVTTTPLQMATMFSAIANGGTVYQPHVAMRIDGADGNLVRRIDPEAIGRLPISQKQVAALREALQGVVISGTAKDAFLGFPLTAVPVAGKTGTAQVIPKQDYSWFAAMAPAGDPQYVVVALVEEGGHGAQTAAPIVRRILEGLFQLPATPLFTGESSD